MRLIDADELPMQKMIVACGNGQYKDVDIVNGNDIDNAPTIDPASLIEKPIHLDAEKVAKIVREKLADGPMMYADGPMIEYVPAMHGRWEKRERRYDSMGDTLRWHECSICGYDPWGPPERIDEYNYCPNCGAKMHIADIGKDNVG